MKKTVLLLVLTFAIVLPAYAQDAPDELSPSEINALQPTGNTGSNEIPAGQTTFGDDYGQTYETQQATNPQYQGNPGTQSSSGNNAFVPLAPIPGLTQGVTADTQGLANFFNNLYKFLIGFAAVLAVIEIIWGGLEIMSKDSIAKNKDGKERIKMAILGLILVLSPVLVFTLINPQILNLSIGLGPLDTKSSGSFASGTSPSGTSPAAAVTDPGTQCSVQGVAGILQIATCPTGTAAQQWGQKCAGGRLSSPTTVTIQAGGTPGKTIITCTGTQKYTFIETIGTLSAVSAINRLQPLAVTTENQNNGSNVMTFANICRASNLSWKVCISDLPETTFSTECSPKPVTEITAASRGSGKCYKESLSCEDRGKSAYCTEVPEWKPFQ